ncbi:uncharacterized protein TNCV_1994451 [Trichonephila clavipes]|nr:uncharacterized protein TNCV_1994451 [Trichonephila clavipes]
MSIEEGQNTTCNVWFCIILLEHRFWQALKKGQNHWTCKAILQSVPDSIKARMWFQHDGAPPHFSVDVRSALDTAYLGRWIGRGGPVNWPASSPDLSCLDFFLWGHMKSLIYTCLVYSDGCSLRGCRRSRRNPGDNRGIC